MTSVDSVPPFLLGGVHVAQPPHLEGDPSLATEILPGPPSLLSLQQTGNRKDTKKPSAPISYLPGTDPGSTYSALAGGAGMTTITSSDVDGPRRKRARTNKGAPSSRPQRASARVLNATSSATDLTANGHEALVAWSAQPTQQESQMASSSLLDLDESRSTSGDEGVPVITLENGANGKGRAVTRKDKGKGKEKEKPPPGIRIKEEPVAITFNLNDFGPPLPNEDHCSSCQSFGSLVYCDSCPKAFHLWCLNPPMESQDLPEGETRWFCPACVIQTDSPPTPLASLKFMSSLIQQLHCSIPTEFRLPEEIRSGFRDVTTGSRGAYVDGSELKPPRLNRHGQLEDRDPRRLKDRNGDPVLCFQCGLSALPSADTCPPPTKRPRRASNKLANTDTWKSIISCDYCELSWHLDCLDPPIAVMPAYGVKWMCPNHAEQVHKPKRRIPKQQASFIEITRPNQPNNGNIEIVHNEFLTSEENQILVDEISINGRRYRVPERVVKLDFWSKVNGTQPVEPRLSSPLSSPLTSLSSLDDFDETSTKTPPVGLYSIEDILAAQALWSFKVLDVPSPAIAVPPPTLNGTSNSVEVSHGYSTRHAQASTRQGKRKVEDPEPIIISNDLVSDSPTLRKRSPPPEASNGRRRSARQLAQPAKRVRIDLTDDTSSESWSTPTASQPPQTTSISTAKSHVSGHQSSRTAEISNKKTEAKLMNGGRPPRTATQSTTKKKAKRNQPKAAKSTTSVTNTPIKTEPDTSPKLAATPSLKIRLPRLSALNSTTSAPISAPSRTTAGDGAARSRKSRRQTSASIA